MPKQKKTKLTAEFAPAEINYLNQLLRTGVYGSTLEEVIHTLVMEEIRGLFDVKLVLAGDAPR